MVHCRNNINVTFRWCRGSLFDRMAVTILFERCLNAKIAKVTKLQKKPTSKWRPLPLTTVELQKLGSMFLHMDSQKVMKVGIPRSHNDTFSDRDVGSRGLVHQGLDQLPPYRDGSI